MAASEYPYRVLLRLAPRAGVTSEMQRIVDRAFAAAGVTDVEWFGLAGDVSARPGTRPVAAASLTVRLQPPPGIRSSPSRTVASPVSEALRQIRASVSSLPLGVETALPDGLRRLSFAAADSPDDIAEGLREIENALGLEAPVVAWRASERRWTVL
jgi:hypothetical protein